MKKSVFLLGIVIISITGYSQLGTPWVKPVPRLKSDSIVLPKNAINNIFQSPSAYLSHQTARGKVYKLSPDNMPCLRPDSAGLNRMPIRRSTVNDRLVRPKSN